jgi:hypothetical protein
MEKNCTWYKKFDGHYSISCANETNQRANGEFHPYIHKKGHKTRWQFIYCPYCGGKIIICKMGHIDE